MDDKKELGGFVFYGLGMIDKHGGHVMDSRTMDVYFDGSGYDIDEKVERMNEKGRNAPYRAVELFYKKPD